MKTYAENINSAQVLQSGMRNNAAEASTRGCGSEKTDLLDNFRTEAVALNEEQASF